MSEVLASVSTNSCVPVGITEFGGVDSAPASRSIEFEYGVSRREHRSGRKEMGSQRSYRSRVQPMSTKACRLSVADVGDVLVVSLSQRV